MTRDGARLFPCAVWKGGLTAGGKAAGARCHANRDYTNSAREILMARVTEADILAGRLVTPGSRLKMIVSRLGRREQN